jgi:hypothetical protein
MTKELSKEQIEAKQADRHARVTRVVDRLQKGRRFRDAKQLNPSWTQEEYAILIPFCARIKSKERSYYETCNELMGILKNRSFEAIRKKLKNYVNHGIFL